MTHTTELVPVQEAPSPGSPQPPPERRRSLNAELIWGLIAVGVVAAVALLLISIASGPEPRTAVPGGLSGTSSRPGVPLSADGAERHLAGGADTRPVGVPRSADGAERHLAGLD